MAGAQERRERSASTRTRSVAVALVAAVAAAGVAIGLATATTGSAYRTAVARTAAVMKTVAVTGTVEPVDRVTLSFGVSGTVATVAVHVGERVTAGQTLATLARTSLTQQVTDDEATLRAAQAIVTADEKGQTAGTATDPSTRTTAGATTPGGPPGTGSTSGTTAPSGTPTTLHAAQQDVVNAQKAADAAEQAAAAALSTADSVCGTTPKSTGTGTGGATTTTTAPRGTGSGTACAPALHDALAAQQAVATDQRAVTSAETALAKLLAQGGGSESGSVTGSGTGSSSATSTATTPSSPGAATGTPVGTAATTPRSEAAQLASDQATVDTDDATLLVAQQSLSEADLTSPITGTVGAVNVAKGDVTAAGSSTAALTILTQHAFEAEGLVSPTEVPTLAVGDAVQVSVDGRPSPIPGRVTHIGPVDTALDYQYPVVVALPAGIPRLFTGSLCQMTVVVHVAKRTLAVPTSAVRTTKGHAYVTVLRNGRTHRQSIAVGIVGTEETQVLSGVARGDQVVLATLERPLPKPSSGVSTNNRSGFPVPFPGTHIFIGGNGGGIVYSYSSSG